MKSTITTSNINEYGRFDELVKTVNFEKAKEFFDKLTNSNLSQFEVNMEVNELLTIFILSNGIDIENYKIK